MISHCLSLGQWFLTVHLNGLLDSHYLCDNLVCSGPGRDLKLTISLMYYRVVRFRGKVQDTQVNLWLFVTRWTAACQASLYLSISQSLLKLMSVESVMPSNQLILYYPLLLLLSIFASIRVFSNKLALCIKWPNYWSYSFNISPSYEYSGLISFRIACFDLLAVQRILKSLL